VDTETNQMSLTAIRRLKHKYDCVIVDEMSMLNGELWDNIDTVKTYTGLPIYIFGDWKQLKPIGSNRCFREHTLIKRLVDYNYIELEYHSECRSDKDLVEFVKSIKTPEDLKTSDTINRIKTERELPLLNITLTNSERERINDKVSQQFIKGKTSYMIEDFGSVCKGMKLISLENEYDTESSWKGERFTIVQFGQVKGVDVIYVKSDIRKEHHAYYPLKEFAATFDLGFAITCHSAIGRTFDEPYCIHQYTHKHADMNWLYTALTRGKPLKQVSITDWE
jgi:ATP-dependent exoDNAse (exonuclease V) alpha subunit